MASGALLIKNGRVIDPGRNFDQVASVLVRDGRISIVGEVPADQIPQGCQVIDATGLVVSPGFIDIHCHLREPGFEYKETIATGTRAGARGGFTSLCCMPNTEPPIDNAAVVDLIRRRSREDAVVRVHPVGCVTKGRKGKALAEMEELASAGVVAFSDDGDPVYDANIMRLALSYSADLGIPITNHCEEHALSRNGVMAEGWIATRLGLPGIPAAAEEAMIARDISLAELTGGRLHLAHITTSGAVPLLRQAKGKGLNVTAEVCPHHLTITDKWVLGTRGIESSGASTNAYDTSTKVYPPLRGGSDVEALIEGLADGLIDCIATDHAPHEPVSKQVTYNEAAFGISVLETALGSSLQLVHAGRMTLNSLVDRMTVGPARVLGPTFDELATLEPGTPADIVVFDSDLEWEVDPSKFESKGKNTPLRGTTLKGGVVTTIVEGKVVYTNAES
ncbi:MAG: hypothetical protein BZY81_02905 [SAR202 cluster bacterium Io17-Chloro-G4]|nr:MAG: hypothetical protein BZY81_02905 [SAR202 cluster bacterium Io17-Chloro-G4]